MTPSPKDSQRKLEEILTGLGGFEVSQNQIDRAKAAIKELILDARQGDPNKCHYCRQTLENLEKL